MARVERFANPRDSRDHKSTAAAPAHARRPKKPNFNGLLVVEYNATQIKEPPPSSPPEEDESAYVLASVLMNQYRFESYAKLTSFLTKYAIRTRKPSLNRLLVHAGDFAKQIERRDEEQIEALDQSEEFIKGAQERQVEIREKKKKGQK